MVGVGTPTETNGRRGHAARDTVLSRVGRRRGSVFLKVVLGLSVLIDVRLQELCPHRQAGGPEEGGRERGIVVAQQSVEHNKSSVDDVKKSPGRRRSPVFLGTQAQNLWTFGTFGTLGPPVGSQSQVPVGVFMRRGVDGPSVAQSKRPAVVTRTDCGKTTWRETEGDVRSCRFSRR